VKNKLIKAFMPFAIGPALYEWCGKATKNPARTAEVIEYFVAKDPGDHDWSSIGMVAPVEEGSYVHDLDGAARLVMIQFAERKLPASVRDDAVKVRYKELAEKEGRPLNKKEFAQLREDVESSLLPQAFIIRKAVAVFVFKDRLLIGTSSASQAEKILVFISRLCNTRNVPWEFIDIKTTNTPGHLLGQVARNGVEYIDDDDSMKFAAGNAAVFKGEDKRAIRVKDRDLSSDEVQKIMTSGSYNVTELAMSLVVIDDVTATFTLTDKFILKAIKLSDVTVSSISGDTVDQHAMYWLLAKTFASILSAITSALNEGESDDTGNDDDL
jgi:DNA recombination-dependent growth factor C